MQIAQVAVQAAVPFSQYNIFESKCSAYKPRVSCWLFFPVHKIGLKMQIESSTVFAAIAIGPCKG